MKKLKTKFRGPYDRKRVQLTCREPTRTKQSFQNECDINQILAKYQKTGAITHLAKHKANYGFASALDFTESMNIVAKAQSMFNELPSSIREKFNNDPADFLLFVQNADNADELVSLGLANAPEAPPQASKEVALDEPSLVPKEDPAPDPPPPSRR